MQINEAINIMNNFLKDTPKAPYECLMNKEIEAVETLLVALHKTNKEKYNQKSLRRFNERKYRKVKTEHRISLKRLKKQDKIINEMTKQLVKLREESENDCFIPKEFCDVNKCIKRKCEECIKEYFIKKVEEKQI